MAYLLALLFFFLPTYLIRFHLGPLPTTLLEILFGAIFIIFVIKNKQIILSPFSFLLSEHKSLLIAISLFLIAATISVFTSLNIRAALGEWKTFYVEPVILFFILITTLQTSKKSKKREVNLILSALILSGLITSLLSIYQHYTGWFVPHAFWANRDTYRVTAWYQFPNAVGLFLAPLVPLALFVIRDRRYMIHAIIYHLSLISIPATLLAIAFAKSTGGLIGVAAGIGVLLLFNKKTRTPALGIAGIALTAVFLLPSDNSVRQELLAQNRSGQIRVAMWKEAGALLKDRPLLGAGLASYAERVEPYHGTVNGEGVEIFHHPHNIFLTMWVNLGLLGLIGFILILVWFFRVGLQTSDFRLQTYVLASMTALLVMGLVDSPYIKNDLAMFFWLLPALMIVASGRDNKNERYTPV